MLDGNRRTKVEFIESYIKLGDSDYQWNDNHGELIRCNNCQFHNAGENEVDAWDRCRLHSINTEPDNYCSWSVKNERSERNVG